MLKLTIDSATEFDCYVQVFNSTGDAQLDGTETISGKLGSTTGTDTYDADTEMIFFDLAEGGGSTSVVIKIEETGLWTEANSIVIVQDHIA